MRQFTLYLIRHGQTYYNIYNKLQGWSNSPLTEKGWQNAQTAGERLKNIEFAAAFCSDLPRAELTAREILKHNLQSSPKEPIVSPLFREQFYGYFEGTDMNQAWYVAGAPHDVPSFKEIVEKYSLDQAKDFLKAADPFHHAENHQEYWHRLNQGIELIRQTPTIHNNSNVLLVSHGNTLLSLVERFGKGKFDVTKRPANGSLTKLAISDQQIKVISFNK
ncbi:histidine phosphatase family protein [Liquorilactobacillus nagelii]|uniref:histidine phosphatase family protein n=1 Tax=Liquorilactobacillus nagelii TaxID=82688 RepID=UPI0006EFECF4|nr:histidine phosphatase family protein [Liquorilactobacillus nagelii]KRL42244.1 phosphoglycerate mutase family protein [Liquorilactobacillus nagelii DSM 13675]QYH54954.1 histidine phosphatase family protein [Liquorilactobacillus nagelii DSM 13675]